VNAEIIGAIAGGDPWADAEEEMTVVERRNGRSDSTAISTVPARSPRYSREGSPDSVWDSGGRERSSSL
jgi:hypothetical protein